jgi:1-acyl-sn-glycerol-3-phosphate acyltransferase
MVDRGSPAARAKSMVEMLSFLRKNISIVIAPEGTFNETGHPLKSFFDGAFKLAVETGVPVKPVLFLDGYARLHPADIFSLTPGRSRAVFLEEIPVEGLTKDDVPHLKDLVFKKMEAALIKYEADWILK